MKKVKVITRQAICNYGSLLQAIATEKIFSEMGYDVKIIEYISNDEKVFPNVVNYAKKRGLKGIKKITYVLLKFSEQTYKSIKFKKLRKKYLNLTKQYNSISEMKNRFDNEILCSGGDQLFGFMPYGSIDPAYYLAFGNESNKFISLSSSFGRYDFSDELKNQINLMLKKYHFITVRENSAVEFLSDINIKSTCVLDPTLLVDRKLYYDMAIQKKLSQKYVLVYKLGHNEVLNELAIRLAKKHNLKIYYITNTVFKKNTNGKTFVNKKLDKVLQLFRDAEYVVTDSFHATVFSLIFEKNFFTNLPGQTNARIVDFLNDLGLGNRYFNEIQEVDCDAKIDFNEINKKLNTKRNSDYEFIKDKLISV